ncbi:hypothetical protein KHA80_20790 [Anaerobacillus sp. HL2]|nr:hypothetical protein KHA80_20790 [Anaerobacillus sp. HL2]
MQLDVYNDELIIKFEKLDELLQAFKKPLRKIVKSTEAYSDSVKKVFITL